MPGNGSSGPPPLDSLPLKSDNSLNHVWHDHPESKICISHGNASLMHGDPAAVRCSRSVMAICSLRLARAVVGAEI
jgi:hypothetical protein